MIQEEAFNNCSLSESPYGKLKPWLMKIYIIVDGCKLVLFNNLINAGWELK